MYFWTRAHWRFLVVALLPWALHSESGDGCFHATLNLAMDVTLR